MNNFNYTRCETPEQAARLLGSQEGAKLLAGGTDLVPLIKEGLEQPETVVDMRGWATGSKIVVGSDGLHIGALATLDAIARLPLIKEKYTALSEACNLAASPQLRVMGTLGGNLFQQTRCWYFRGPFDCWLKGGDVCMARQGENEGHAIFLTGESPCVSAHPSDPAGALIVLGASVVYIYDGESSSIPVEEFFALPSDSKRNFVSLPDGAVVTELTIPSPHEQVRSTYVKSMQRASWSFALAGVALSLTIENDTVSHARVALTGVAPVPIRATALEAKLIGTKAEELAVEELTPLIVDGARPLSQNGYKLPLLQGLFRQALHVVISERDI